MSQADNLADIARAFLGTAGNQSLAASGYQKLPSGLIIQWGQSVISGSSATSGNQLVTLPLAFPTGLLQVVMGGQNVSVPAAGVSLGWTANSAADFSLRWSVITSGQLSGGTAVTWLAIGY